MSKVKMDAQYFIDKFEAIPETQWCVGGYRAKYKGEEHERCCALGHCGEVYGANMTVEGSALDVVLGDAAAINDGENHLYQQGTPKQRILAALYDAKEFGL